MAIAASCYFQPGRTLRYLVQFVGFDHDVLTGTVLVAADDGGAVDGSVHRALRSQTADKVRTLN
jgi:hypothetical protein